MKLAFLAAHGFARDELRALTLSFYRWTWGPMSNEVYDAWEMLERAGMLEREEQFVFTQHGQSLARDFYEDVVCDERNIQVREQLDRIVSHWRLRPDTTPLLNFVYGMEIGPPGRERTLTVRDVRNGEHLIEPIGPQAAIGSLHVDRGWLETLALTLVPGAADAVNSGVADFWAGGVHGA